MGNFQKNTLLTLITLALAGTAQSAMAISIATATFEWGNLTLQLTDTSGGANPVHFVWGDDSSKSYENTTYSETGTATQESTLYSNPSTTHAATSGASSDGIINSNVLQAASQIQLSTAPTFAFADVSNYAEFTIFGQGYVDIFLDWRTAVTGEIGNSNEYSSAQAFFIGHQQGQESQQYSDTYINSIVNGTGDAGGTFSLHFENNGDNPLNGNLQAEVLTESHGAIAPVPIPAAIWLLGSSLIGLTHFSQRKQVLV